MTSKIYSRRELYNLVWSEPISKLASEHGLSDRGMAKQCDSANVPLPGRGYWARKPAGQAALKTPLPPRAPGAADRVKIGPARTLGPHRRPPARDLLAEEPVLKTFAEDLDEMEAAVRAKVGKLPSARRAGIYHPSLQRLLDKDEEQRRKASERGYGWPEPLFDSPFERRRLKVLNAIFLGLAKAGCGCEVDKEGKGLVARVGDSQVSFTLEDSKAPRLPPHERPRGRTPVPSGLLRLVISSGWNRDRAIFECQEEVDAPLEDRVTEMVIALVLGGERQLREGAQWSYDWDVQQRARLIEEDRERRAEEERKAREAKEAAEKARLDELLNAAQAWRQAQEIRSYVTAVRRAPDALGLLGEGWCEWALTQASRLDPLVLDTIPEKQADPNCLPRQLISSAD